MGHIGIPEIILIVLAVIVLFGAKKLPEIGSALGKAIREFKKAGKDIETEVKADADAEDKNNEQKS
ncbi:MAG: twin-arginine translocase TatA/TatE family subunit [Candidatus Omnitrophica bacterium]|nr:twin-arginine translocase TatA/TatE family subunit [Candidatus Omnitrophota bacterium]MCK5083511.1 twin-arginine translocase TatA/TatE family subunit [Candidatus Omnitrophota bacterium]